MNTSKMKHTKLLFLLIAALAFASCGSDEPRYADPEAHEKTVQLNEQYGPLMVGTWHYENISDTQRYFERLTFQGDGTLTGMRKWQTRKLVTIDGEQRYTGNGEKRNCLLLNAHYEGANSGHMAYSNIATFDYADETTLRFEGFYFKDKDGWITFLRGEAEPGF